MLILILSLAGASISLIMLIIDKSSNNKKKTILILASIGCTFILTAVSFGIIGAIGKVINDSIQTGIRLKDIDNQLLVPIQGGIIGIIMLGISYTIPVALTNDNVSLKPITIVFLSLFGGVFYLGFYKWFTEMIDNVVFKKKN